MTNIDLTLVIPCYNEELVLESSVNQVFEVLDNSRFCYEVIFVDDHSWDNTRGIIEDIIRRNPDKKITKIFHNKNEGRGQAVSSGIKAAEGNVVGFVDIDLETQAHYIPPCVLAVKRGVDIALARRIYKFQLKSIHRYIISKGYILFVRRLLGIPLRDTETGFKFFNRKKILPLIDEVKEKGWFWDTEIMARAYFHGYRIEEIPCLYQRNFKKRSTVNVLTDSIYYFKRLIDFKKHSIKKPIRKPSMDYWHSEPGLYSQSYSCKGNVFVNRFLEQRKTHISGLMHVNEGAEAIDVGCGSGVFSKILLEKGARVTAVDYSKEMLNICENELRGLSKDSYSLVNSDAASLQMPDNKFDLLIAVGLLDYVDDIEATLKEFHRVVKPKGTMIFTIPKRPSPFFLLRSAVGNHIRKKVFKLPPIANALSRTKTEHLLTKTGLTLTDIKSFYMTMWIIQCSKQLPQHSLKIDYEKQ